MLPPRLKRRIAVAAGVSALVHVAIMSRIPGPPPERPDGLVTLQATLAVTPPPAAAPQPAVPAVRPPAPRPRPPRATPAPRPEQPTATLPEPMPERAAPAAEPTLPPTEPQRETPPVAEAPVEPAPVAEAPPPVVAPAKPVAVERPVAVRTLPGQGRITYSLYIGADRFNVGRAVTTWTITGDQYRLSTRSETTGLAALFRPYQLALSSEGEITAGGLRPRLFTVQRGARGTERAAAEFDWPSGRIRFVQQAQGTGEPLEAGAQDLLSGQFQFGLIPLEGRTMRTAVTNGTKIDRYDFEIGVEEKLDTVLGELRTLPIRRVRRPGDEGQEFWLAIDYLYLPVRVRLIGRDGNVTGEQLVTEIAVGRE